MIVFNIIYKVELERASTQLVHFTTIVKYEGWLAHELIYANSIVSRPHSKFPLDHNLFIQIFPSASIGLHGCTEHIASRLLFETPTTNTIYHITALSLRASWQWYSRAHIGLHIGIRDALSYNNHMNRASR